MRYPPDLSLITKARDDGANYVYSLLTGYRTPTGQATEEVPGREEPAPGLHFNPISPTSTSPCRRRSSDGQVTYADGTKATVDQMAKDVSAFLVWTAEPKLENRHRAGWAVVIFLLIATILAYLAYRNIWANAKREVSIRGPLEPAKLGSGLLLIRKDGKLPGATIAEDYALEYGTDRLTMHVDACAPGARCCWPTTSSPPAAPRSPPPGWCAGPGPRS
jgi:hypothetical protein